MSTAPVELWGGSENPEGAHEPETVRLEAVSKVYRDGRCNGFVALLDVSLEIPPAAPALIEGPSGSGKSTLLGVIGGMIRPTSGRVRVGARDLTRLHEEELAEFRRSELGFLFQNRCLVRGISVLENVLLPAIPRPGSNGDLISAARTLLRLFGLDDRAGERVEKLSGGEQQRVALARAMINDPRIILADEPTAHQDELGTRRFLEFVERVAAQGRTIIAASHDPALCESGLFPMRRALHGGRLICRRATSWY